MRATEDAASRSVRRRQTCAREPNRLSVLPLFAAVSATDTLTPPAPMGTPVEGSNGLLLEIDGKVVPNYAATMVSFEEGDVVKGKVVRIDKDEVLVDIGYKSEGVIPSHELSIRKSVNPADEVEPGEEIDALVLTKEDSEGRLVLSKKRARFEKAWRRIEAAAESGEPVEGNVIEVVKGGLILDLGVRGFLPASLVDIRRVHNLEEFTGQTLECKVIELNRSRNNVVLSRRAVLEEERKEVREQILGRLEPGQVVEGKISNIVDFGAFVDLDGIDGLIHISELSWSHVNHPSEVVAIGDTVRIKVLDIDRDRQRISLGLKQTQEDPWQRVISAHRPGDVLEGNVTKVVAFGAFVEILPGVEGLVHISELADHHVESPSEVVEPGTTLNVKILEIDEERRRLSLSIKQVEEKRMAMGDLGEQIQEANDEGSNGTDDEGSDESTAGPVAEGDPSSSQAAGDVPPSTPPAEDTLEAEEAPAAEAEAPAAEETEAEEPAAEEASAEGDEPEASES
jgi:small subunit ribosomal protein S1